MTTYAPGTLKGLIDSTPDTAVLVRLAEFYAQRTLPATGWTARWCTSARAPS